MARRAECLAARSWPRAMCPLGYVGPDRRVSAVRWLSLAHATACALVELSSSDIQEDVRTMVHSFAWYVRLAKRHGHAGWVTALEITEAEVSEAHDATRWSRTVSQVLVGMTLEVEP
jgi:hypothetical protein